jgi:hypothetical protein
MVLKGGAGEITLEILRYENLHALCIEDRNWLRAVLAVRGGPLSGKAEFGIMTGELSLLSTELSASLKTLNRGIRYAAMEGNWKLNVDFERTGAALVSGVFIPLTASRNALHYHFESDPISLQTALSQLRQLVKKYPVKTTL